MILSDRSILEQIKDSTIYVSPFEPANVQPASLDLRIGPDFKSFRYPLSRDIELNPWTSDVSKHMIDHVVGDEGYLLRPGEFALATTMETIGLPGNLVGRVDGRSSIGRLGIAVHSTAGFIDPGFSGQITLELSNVGCFPIRLYPGKRVCQISFHLMSTPADAPYGHPSRTSKYQGQTGATASRVIKDA